MGQIDENVIKKLDRVLLKGSPILFTGAGFSKFAINGDGETVPDGCQLKKGLIEKLLLIDESEPEFLYGAQNEAYMSRSAEKWVRGLCFNELGVGG